MTRTEFQKLPHLVMEHHVVALGYGRSTLSKFVDCGVLRRVCPTGCGQARYQKKQLAELLGWQDLLAVNEFKAEKPLLEAKTVAWWTGWSAATLGNMVAAGGLRLVKPPGAGKGKFLKSEIAGLIGLEHLV